MALPRFAREHRLSSCFCALGGKNLKKVALACRPLVQVWRRVIAPFFFFSFLFFFLTRGWWSVYEWAKRPGRWLVPLCLRVPWALWHPFRSSLDQTALAIITKYNQHVITWHKCMLSAFPQMKYGRHTFLFILSFSSFHWSHNLRVFAPKLRFGWWIANVITDYISSLFTRVFVTAP